jgi:hypothetical protein
MNWKKYGSLMAGKRLERWSTLPRDVLTERISREENRRNLSFAETQLLDAARERLLKWKAPSLRSSLMNGNKFEGQTDTTKTVVGEFVEDATKATPAAKETATDKPAKVKAAPKKTAKKAAPAAKSAAPAANKKEAEMAKKSKTKATAKKAKSNGGGKRIPDDAVLKVKKSFKNPYAEGTGPYKRFEICAKSDGKTYGALRTMASLKPTTPLNFAKAGGGEFISPEGK